LVVVYLRNWNTKANIIGGLLMSLFARLQRFIPADLSRPLFACVIFNQAAEDVSFGMDIRASAEPTPIAEVTFAWPSIGQ
jgi:hypothetical protein